MTAFKACVDADDLSTVLEAAHALVEECKLRITEDGLGIAAVDPSNVAMVDLDGTHQLFASLDVEAASTLGIDLDRVINTLGLFDGLVTLSKNDRGDRLVLNDGRLEATVGLVDTDAIRDEPDLPDLDLAGDVLLEAGELASIITAGTIVAPNEFVTFTAHEGGVRAEAVGDLDDVTLDLAPHDDAVVEFDAPDGEHVTMIDLGFLSDIAKPLPGDVRTRLRWGDEYPLKVHYVIGDGLATVEYMIAPRVDAQ